MGPQRVLAWGHSGSTPKTGGSTLKAIHAILSSSLTQALQRCTTSSYPRRPHPQCPHYNHVSIPQILGAILHCFWFEFLLTFLARGIFFIPAGWPNFFPSNLKFDVSCRFWSTMTLHMQLGVTCMNELCHTYERVMSQYLLLQSKIPLSSCTLASHMRHATHVNESCHTRAQVMSQHLFFQNTVTVVCAVGRHE